MTECRACHSPLPSQVGRGRPRAFCLACSPRDPVAATRAWRARNRDAINSKRRTDYAAGKNGGGSKNAFSGSSDTVTPRAHARPQCAAGKRPAAPQAGG